MSIGPNSFSIRQRMLSISRNLVVSATKCLTVPPAHSISCRTAESAAVSLPCKATFAPSWAKSLAMAAPIPRELPVTSAVLSFRRSIVVVLLQAGRRLHVACSRHAADRDNQQEGSDALADCDAMARFCDFRFV